MFSYTELMDLINNSDKNLFISGPAGTGKSHAVRTLLQHNNNILALSPTGLAARTISGQTIHSAFNLAPTFQDEIKLPSPKLINLLDGIDTILLDEISMVRSDVLQTIASQLQYLSGLYYGFGDFRVIFVGDPFQLPPVTLPKDRDLINWRFGRTDATGFFNEAPVFLEMAYGGDIEFIELGTNFRQKDDTTGFVQALSRIRIGDHTPADIALINKRFCKIPDHCFIQYLLTTNDACDRINKYYINLLLKGPVFEVKPIIDIETKNKHRIDSNHPLNRIVILRKGMMAIATSNIDDIFLNGTICEIIDIKTDKHGNPESILIRDTTTKIQKYIQRSIEQLYCTIADDDMGITHTFAYGTIAQFPLLPAYAITIHRSQSLSLDSACVSFGFGSQATGLGYVGLSRVKSLDGLYLTAPARMTDFMVNPLIRNFQNWIDKRKKIIFANKNIS